MNITIGIKRSSSSPSFSSSSHTQRDVHVRESEQLNYIICRKILFPLNVAMKRLLLNVNVENEGLKLVALRE